MVGCRAGGFSGGQAPRVFFGAPVDVNEPYLRAAVLYGAMSGDERQNFEQIQIWSGGQNGPFELAASNEKLAAISPINFLDRINTPISLGIKVLQHFTRQLHRRDVTDHAKVISTIAHFHPYTTLHLAQVFIELPAQVGETLVVGGFQGEIVKSGLYVQMWTIYRN